LEFLILTLALPDIMVVSFDWKLCKLTL